MTPSSFAKLVLRLVVSGTLFLYLPLSVKWILIYASSQHPDTSSLGESFANAMILAAPVVIFLSGLFIWFRAQWLTRFLLPAGISTVEVSNYRDWERSGLMVIGGWLIVKASLGIPTLIFGNSVYTGDPDMLPFNLVAGVILIFGWRTIVSAAKRLARPRRKRAMSNREAD